MAVTASIGVAIVILTDLILLPVLVSWVHWDDHYRARVEVRQAKLTAHWSKLARITERKPAAIIIGIAVLLGIFGVWKGRETPIGDTQAGVPELRADSRYNRDSNIITSEILHRRRRPHGDRRDERARLHELRAHDRHRHLRVEDAQRRRRAGSDGAAHRGQDRNRRLERGQSQVAQHSARAQPAHAVHALHRDQHRPAERRLQRDPGDAVPARSQGRDHRARGERGQRVAHAQHFPQCHLQPCDRQRRRHGRHQRGSEGQGISRSWAGCSRP